MENLENYQRVENGKKYIDLKLLVKHMQDAHAEGREEESEEEDINEALRKLSPPNKLTY
jgi:hypothetical protein